MDKFFALIEGGPFRNQVVAVNSLATLTTYVEEMAEFKSMLASYGSYPQEGAELLRERIHKLKQIRHNPKYAHPYDASIAVYLFALYRLSKESFEALVQDLQLPDNTWWSKQMFTVLGALASHETSSFYASTRKLKGSAKQEVNVQYNDNTETNALKVTTL
jgi:hypothetical protein